MTAAETSSELELLHRAYDAFNRRDFESVLAMMRPDVDWPNGMVGGRMVGVPAVRDYWRRQFELLESRVEPLAFTPKADGRIAVKVHQIVHDKSGQLVGDQIVDHVYAFRDGQIASMEIRS